jgi:ATP-dependent DNA ligase
MYQVVFATPVLESTNSSNRKKFWQAFVAECSNDIVAHFTTSWQELADGGLSRKNRSELTTVAGKNVGRTNETTPLDQARSEVKSLMNKKIDEGYHEAGVESTVLPLPMLASRFTERGSCVKFPCYLQPKLDGARMLYGGYKGWSRKGKLYIPEVITHLQFDTGGCVIDGECMLSQGHTFQTSMAAIKKFNPKLSPQLEYYAFDIVDPESPFEQRLIRLKELFQSETIPPNVHMVKTYLCNSEDEVVEWLAKALAKGYEGVILRNMDGLYAVGQRSVDLQKLKTFIDSDYLITGCTDGKGRESEAIIYVCQTVSGDEFTVRPEGNIEDRKVLWQQFKSGTWVPVGQKLTVRYQELTDSGIPRFPVGVTIRDYEG